MKTTPILGDEVRTATGSRLGRIDDVLVDLDSGSVTHVLVTFEHVLGLHEQRFAVRPEALTMGDMDPADGASGRGPVVLDVDPDALVSPETATLLLV